MAQVETSVPVKPLSVAGRALTTEETHVVRSPWNGAPIAAGCGTVLRPARAAPLAAIELVRILHEAGLPPALLSVVAGPADEIGDVLVEDERVRMITFTGSAEVGWKLAERAAKKHISL